MKLLTQAYTLLASVQALVAVVVPIAGAALTLDGSTAFTLDGDQQLVL